MKVLLVWQIHTFCHHFHLNFSFLNQECKDSCLKLILHHSLCSSAIQWNPSKMDNTGTTDFVLYGEVPFAQGLVVTMPLLQPLHIMRSKTMDNETDCIDKRFIDI